MHTLSPPRHLASARLFTNSFRARRVLSVVRPAAFFGAFAAAIGVLVLLGWFTRDLALVQVIPASVAMKFNTAFCFVLSGCGLVSLSIQSRRTGLAFGSVVFCFGFMTLLEHETGWNFHIDQLLMHDYISGQSSFPGRMALVTSFCFAASGVSLITLAISARISLSRVVVGGLSGLIIASLGAAALGDYVTNLSAETIANGLVKMAVHTAACFVALGCGTVALALAQRKSISEEPVSIRLSEGFAGHLADSRRLPAAAAVVVGCLSIVVWWQLVTKLRTQCGQTVQVQADRIAAVVDAELASREHALERLSQHWVIYGAPSRNQWEADALQQVRDLPGYICLSYTDNKGTVKWISQGPGTNAVISRDSRLLSLMDDRRLAGSQTMSRPVNLPSVGKGLILSTPVTDASGHSLGRLSGLLQDDSFFRAILPSASSSDYRFSVSEGAQTMFRWNGGGNGSGVDDRVAERWATERSIRHNGLKLKIRIWPTASALVGLQSTGPEAALALGLGLAVLVATTTHLAQNGRRHARALDLMNEQLRGEMAIRAEADAERQIFLREVQLERMRAVAAQQEAERQTLLLDAKASELERSNAALEEFASVASHDLKEPLRKIQTFGDMLQRRAGPELDDTCRGYLERMTGASARMQTLIEGLLAYSQVSRKTNAMRTVDLNDIVRGVVSDMEINLSTLGGRVDVALLPHVHADPSQLRQLFLNLIENSLKFYREGIPPRVCISSEMSGDGFVRIMVQDNGVGFDPRYSKRIFELFERLESGNRFEGTGIGLALCRKIVESHCGRIFADGIPGVGTTVTIELPLCSPSAKGSIEQGENTTPLLSLSKLSGGVTSDYTTGSRPVSLCLPQRL